MDAPSILWFLVSCFFLWYGTSLIVSSIDRVARGFKISAFSLSFFLLGMLTSLPEIAVGVNALLGATPEVFVGNLLGGIPIIFLLVIPVLAIFGNGVKVNHELTPFHLIVTFVTIAAPSLCVLDRKVTNPEAIGLIFLYLFLFILLEEKKGGILRMFVQKNSNPAKKNGFIMIKIFFGSLLVFYSARYLLSQTVTLATTLGILPFYVSLIILSLGTNIPELSLAVQSVLQGKKGIALGDYLGSAAANTILFGIFSLLTPVDAFAVDHSWITTLFIVGGLVMFYKFYTSKRDISRKEGFFLLGMYIVFAYLELH